jgi:hypothetical protein
MYVYTTNDGVILLLNAFEIKKRHVQLSLLGVSLNFSNYKLVKIIGKFSHP